MLRPTVFPNESIKDKLFPTLHMTEQHTRSVFRDMITRALHAVDTRASVMAGADTNTAIASAYTVIHGIVDDASASDATHSADASPWTDSQRKALQGIIQHVFAERSRPPVVLHKLRALLQSLAAHGVSARAIGDMLQAEYWRSQPELERAKDRAVRAQRAMDSIQAQTAHFEQYRARAADMRHEDKPGHTNKVYAQPPAFTSYAELAEQRFRDMQERWNGLNTKTDAAPATRHAPKTGETHLVEDVRNAMAREDSESARARELEKRAEAWALMRAKFDAAHASDRTHVLTGADVVTSSPRQHSPPSFRAALRRRAQQAYESFLETLPQVPL
jgi:hypothetical protein